MKQNFDFDTWQRQAALSPHERVELITLRIERACTDIAPAYDQWRNLGFALAQGLGEEGRSFYHRLSRFYPHYDAAHTDKQYTACLRSGGKGITLATFFHLARQAGVDISGPMLPDCQIDTLPPPPFGARHRGGPASGGASSGGGFSSGGTSFGGNPAFAGTPSGGNPSLGGASPAGSPSGGYASPAGRPSYGYTALAGHPSEGAACQPAVLPPVFPDEVYASLPRLLTDVCSYGMSPEDTDLLLLGALTVLSSCLTRVTGIYGHREVYPNLYLFVHAPASAGKGRLTLCRHLVSVVHADLRSRNRAEWEEYRRKKASQASSRKPSGAEDLQQPPVRMLFIPANSTATALFQVLNDNDGQALMFETEGDTLSTTFRSEHGNYSDGLRKAFHHEPIAYNRRKDREYVEIAQPRLSVLLSGTPRQISALIPDAENGLFSRFLFYNLPLRPVWNNVFATVEGETIDGCFARLGGRFFQFYRRLRQCDGGISFSFTAAQQDAFNRFFAALQDEGLQRYGAALLPSVRRLGLTAYRICMVLGTLRLMDYEGDTPLPDKLTCTDDDFQTMQRMMPVLLQHTALAYASLPREDAAARPLPVAAAETDRDRRCRQMLQAMPATFCRAQWQEQAVKLCISARTADRYLVELCNRGRLTKPAYDSYCKEP